MFTTFNMIIYIRVLTNDRIKIINVLAVSRYIKSVKNYNITLKIVIVRIKDT